MKKVVRNTVGIVFGIIIGFVLNSIIKQNLVASQSLAQYQVWVSCLFAFFISLPTIKYAALSKEQKKKALEKSDKERLFKPAFLWRYSSTLYLIMSCYFERSSSFATIASSPEVDIFIKNSAAIILLPVGLLVLFILSETIPIMINENKFS